MINSGDTAFMLAASGLVLLMTPGLAFFYGGMVRRKNVLSILMQCFILLCAVTLQWIMFGYSLAFGPDAGGVIGNLDWAGLMSVGAEPSAYAPTIPHLVFMSYQGMFAVITPALIIGAFAERIKFSSFLIFMLLWATIIYDPVAHWVWGKGGWLAAAGALDFAGGVVVHVNAGVAALVMAFMIGKREGLYADPFTPHNMPHIVLGTALLWFGWFGFNAGSALAANGVAANAFVTTNVAGAAAGLGWTLIEWMHRRAPTMLGAATGAVAGLATVTPAAGFVSPMAAVFIGAAAAGVCYVAVVVLKAKLDLDDSLDVFGVHGVGGILGAMLTGVFASAAVNPAGVDGFLHGNPGQLSIQAVAVLATLAYSGVGTFVLYKVVDLILGMRVDKKAEIIGLDLSQHREAGYTVLE